MVFVYSRKLCNQFHDFDAAVFDDSFIHAVKYNGSAAECFGTGEMPNDWPNDQGDRIVLEVNVHHPDRMKRRDTAFKLAR